VGWETHPKRATKHSRLCGLPLNDATLDTMLINSGWLLDYIAPRPTTEELLDTLLAMGLEVEECHPLAEELRDVKIGLVRSKEPLPEAEGMYVCQVDVGRAKPLQIVCASKHELQIGWGVPVVEPHEEEGAEGAKRVRRLLSGATIEHGRFRGVESQGMICLDSEMGLLSQPGETGLHWFTDESLQGKPLPEVIDIDQMILDVKVLANRADWMGLLGVAREVAAFRRAMLKLPEAPKFRFDASVEPTVRVTVEQPELCPRYMCGLIRGVRVGPSPPWLASRLTSLGLTTRNNIVDITNFVLREWGQPLHAFDYAQLAGGEIVVRKMRPDETLGLLDGERISGKQQPLIIADGERPVALAGIKGGLETGTTEETVDVLLEAAYFEPISIRRNVRRLTVDPDDPNRRLRPTDSSRRFERGTDPNFMLEGAFRRACSLIVELAGGEIAEPPVDIYPQPIAPRTIELTAERASSFLGTEVDASTIKEGLERLDMKVEDGKVEVPTWRVDATHPVVLIEDVARLIGYDNIVPTASDTPATLGKRCPADLLRDELSRAMAGEGFLECRNPPLVPTAALAAFSTDQGRGPIRMLNPMAEFEVLRTTLLPGLMTVAEASAGPDVESFRFFEVDRVFRPTEEPISEAVESWSLGGLLGGMTDSVTWAGNRRPIDFYHAKGVVENLLDLIGAGEADYLPAEQPGFVAGQTAEVRIEGQPAGFVGALDPQALGKTKIRAALFGFDLNLNRLLPHFERLKMAERLPTKPPVTRDLAVVVRSAVPFGQLAASICTAAGEILERVACLDLYEGKQVPAGHKSLAVSLHFRDPQDRRTLESDEVDAAVERIVAELKQQFDAELRG